MVWCSVCSRVLVGRAVDVEMRHERRPCTALLERCAQQLLQIAQRHGAEMVAQLVEAVWVACRHLALEVVDQSEGVLKAEALAGASELEEHNRLALLHGLLDLQKAPSPMHDRSV
jgi:hypothetical protein